MKTTFLFEVEREENKRLCAALRDAVEIIEGTGLDASIQRAAIAKADARLIAAAPDLLAALIELSDSVFDEYTASHPLCERAAEARAVIAQFTGDSV